jgi:hypothetical protein
MVPAFTDLQWRHHTTWGLSIPQDASQPAKNSDEPLTAELFRNWRILG